ncbi:STAS domain-containing protein [Dactylosporangium matsuzakiense]|uniref:STAS domain-containing protein n=1 Tax=Dactylosporangium matsuzakiense TaxID=53360 RepID=A0A9W6KFP6_9ACTN|nr:STAS domain-containing protein [Dactylosporangium matsuzakiense]UWZ42232.1 STAS domain-containing protein [Dactylosporangium matsuzakiense]GLK99883.1 hypothetical protein GCM10017581_016240 [Dactylosporangium matsuzakiense]
MVTREAPIVPLVEIYVSGALDAAGVPRARMLLEDAVELAPTHLVVDLADCPTIDANGIELLVAVHRDVWRNGGRLTLRGMSSRLYRLLALARVDRVLQTASAPAGYRPQHRSPNRAAAAASRPSVTVA